MSDVLIVQPDSLRDVSGRTHGVSAQFSDAAVPQRLALSSAWVAGSLFGGTLMAANGALTVALARTVDALDELAANLVRAADAYEQTDASNADAIAAVFE